MIEVQDRTGKAQGFLSKQEFAFSGRALKPPLGRSGGGYQGVDLTFSLEHTHFLGFVNYGSPIKAMAKSLFGFPVEVVMTENRIEMPVFRSNRIHSNIKTAAGQVIVYLGIPEEIDPKLKKRLIQSGKIQGSSVTPAKHTLYFIYPELTGES